MDPLESITPCKSATNKDHNAIEALSMFLVFYYWHEVPLIEFITNHARLSTR